MSIHVADAVSAYAQAAKQVGPGTEPSAGPNSGFADLLKEVAWA